jgi:hypothetical protein
MLSAEHYALEHRAVQSLLDLRQREVSFMTERFNSIGTQSSLIAGFVVTTMTSLDPATDEHTNDTSVIEVLYVFWVTSALSLTCSVHCILNSTFVAIWGPGLALRGPSGSVSRAYFSMMKERHHIMIAYVASLVFFVLQIIMAFFIVDKKVGISGEALTSTIIMVVGSLVSAFMLRRMARRFFFRDLNGMADEFDGSQVGDGAQQMYDDLLDQDPDIIAENVLRYRGRLDSAAGHGLSIDLEDDVDSNTASLKEALLPDDDVRDAYNDNNDDSNNDSSNNNKNNNNDHHNGDKYITTSTGMSSVVKADDARQNQNQGKMETKSNTTYNSSTNKSGAFGYTTLSRIGGSQQFMHMGYVSKKGKIMRRWTNGFVRLQGTRLFFFHSHEEFKRYVSIPKEKRKKPKSLSLKGYQVLVKTQAEKPTFVLSALNVSEETQRNREFRVEDEAELRIWVQKLMSACFVAQG